MASRFLLLFSVVLFSCCGNSNKAFEPEQYIAFLESNNNDYNVIVEAGNYKYTFQYKTAEYIALKEMDDSVYTNQAHYLKRVESLRNTVWFNVYIEANGSNINPLKNDLNGLDDYNHRVSYFLNEARNNFRCYYGNDIIQQTAYHFENNYGLTPKDAIVIGFKITDSIPKKDIVLEYDDLLFKNEMLKVKISKNQLLTIPAVIL